MTPNEIAELRKLAAAATKLPWNLAERVTGDPRENHHVEDQDEATVCTSFDVYDLHTPEQELANARYITAAANAVPGLCDALDERARRIEELEAALAPHAERLARLKAYE